MAKDRWVNLATIEREQNAEASVEQSNGLLQHATNSIPVNNRPLL